MAMPRSSATLVDIGPILAAFPGELHLRLAAEFDNPLKMLVAKLPHLSKACRDAARHAQAILTCVKLVGFQLDDDAVVAMTSTRRQLRSLHLRGCRHITDGAVAAVAAGCTQLTLLHLGYCFNITEAAVAAVAAGCTQLTSFELSGCRKITDAGVAAVAGCT